MPAKPFISWVGHGAASLAPPATFSGVQAHLFAIEASPGAMQKLVDALLNPATGGVVRYRTVAPVALLSFMDVARCSSAVDQLGWVPGRECAIWVPMLEEDPDNILGSRLVFWAPYIFIDYTIGMVTGREVWGWPKVGARIAIIDDATDNPAFTCTTTIFSRFSPQTEGQFAVLYRIQRPGGSGQRPGLSWENGIEAAEALITNLLGGVATSLLDTLRLRARLPCVALKQFRDAAVATDACFQAIVDSPADITAFRGAGLHEDPFELHVTTCESHQIVLDLIGRDPDQGSTILPVLWASWASIDFEVPPGRNISR
jgi:hypothetical protein